MIQPNGTSLPASEQTPCRRCGDDFDPAHQSISCPHSHMFPPALPNSPCGNAGKAGKADKAEPLQTFDGVPMDGVDWLWHGWLAKGKLTVLAGRGGAGKGTLTARLMAAATGGRKWPDGQKTKPCLAVVVSPDDGLSDTLKPRLHYSDANMALCRHIPADASKDGVLGIVASIRNADPAPGLVVLDIIEAGMKAGGDGDRASDVARHVAEFTRLAEEVGCAFLLTLHLNKRTKSKISEGDLADLVRGSGVWTDAARMVWIMARDESCVKGGRVLVRAKCNLPASRYSEGGYSVRAKDVEFPGAKRLTGTGHSRGRNGLPQRKRHGHPHERGQRGR